MHHLSRSLCLAALLLLLLVSARTEDICDHPNQLERITETNTCEGVETLETYCADCDAVLSSRQQTIVPALGHDPVENVVTVPAPQQPGQTETVCARCGKLLEVREEPYREMMYNHVITALGPRTRDLIGGQEWYRITPLELKQDGTYTYPLIASDRYTVGYMIAVIRHGTLNVAFKLNSTQFRINNKALIIYPDLAAMLSPVQPSLYPLNTPIDIAENFGNADVVLLSLLIRADYDASGAGVGWFEEDANQMAVMRAMIH